MARDEVARRDHQIAGENRREELGTERIACARRQDQEGGSVFTLRRDEAPVSGGPGNPRDALVVYIDAHVSVHIVAHIDVHISVRTSVHTNARAPGSLQQQSFSAKREKIATGCGMWKRTRRPDGLINSQCATGLLSVPASARNGNRCKALCVSPPPHGFSQASFSSKRRTSLPPVASNAAARAPAGPPPTIAMGCCAHILGRTCSVAHVRSRISPHRKQARQRATTFRRRSRAFSPEAGLGRDSRESVRLAFTAAWWSWSVPDR